MGEADERQLREGGMRGEGQARARKLMRLEGIQRSSVSPLAR